MVIFNLSRRMVSIRRGAGKKWLRPVARAMLVCYIRKITEEKLLQVGIAVRALESALV